MESKLSLSRDESSLLERLYNLRDSDSVILGNINKDIYEEENKKQNTTDEKEELEKNIESLELTNKDLKAQKESFISDFKVFSRANYSLLLDTLNKDFDPESLVKSIKEESETEIAKNANSISDMKNQLAELKEKIANSEIELDELNIKLDEAVKNQGELNNMLTELLGGNRNITAQSVTDILLALGFNESECNEAGKLLLFGNTLTVYNDFKNSQSGKNIIDVMREAKEVTEEEPVEEIVKEEPKIEKIIDEIPESEQEAIILGEEEEPVIEETNSYSFDINKFNDEDKALLESSNTNVVEANYNSLIALGFDEKSITKYANLLADSELNEKINTLKNNGKNDKNIKLQIDILTIYTASTLNDAIDKIENAGMKLEEVPLYILNNVDYYISNLEYLNSKGIVLDKSEVAKFSATLVGEPKVIKSTLDLLISNANGIEKPNGKHAIKALSQETAKVEDIIQELNEAGEADLLKSNPEVVSKNVSSILARIKFCKEHAIPYKDEVTGKYQSFIEDQNKFEAILGGSKISLDNTIVTKEENNEALKNIIENEEIINTLKEFSKSEEYTEEPDLSDEQLFFKYSDITKKLEDVCEKDNNDKAYKIGDNIFAKEKYKRNMVKLLNLGLDEADEKLILASLAYNSRKTEEELKAVSESLGFNKAMGGLK